uniref:Chitinase domain-containing protein 1 n=1 Tax=Oryza glumipatula TaxID=40148 RepID=A0A0D9YBS9_9ORYZ
MPPRRRDRRRPRDPSPETSRASTSAASSSSGSRFRPSLLAPLLLLLLLLILAALHFSGRLSLPRPQAPPQRTRLSVHERGLVRRDVSASEILAEHATVSENRSRRHFRNPVLAYVTPWNSKGYDMAKLYSTKFTHISPVWYDLKSDGNKLVLEGQHNFDAKWVSELQSNGSLVLPRVVLEAFPGVVLMKKKLRDKAIDLIVNECSYNCQFVIWLSVNRDKGYDGVVLESWSRWAVYGVLDDSELRNRALQFVKHLGKTLHLTSSNLSTHHHLKLIYVVPAPRMKELNNQEFRPEDLLQLADSVDGFSLMTYDFSGPQNPGPSAPLSWIQYSLKTLLAAKGSASHGHSHMIFLGINFYGNDFLLSKGDGGNAITGRDFIYLLDKYKPSLQWDEKSSEHFFVYSDKGLRHAVFYPTLMSLSLRLDEAQDWGTGLSIWEIGQGLDYFFDVL